MKLTIQGRLNTCLLMMLRTPAEAVRHLLPPGLELATHGRWAFWNIAYGQLAGVRPVGVPESLGMSYRQIAYRLVVRARTQQGEERRGVYFVKSFADLSPARWVGNLLTDFNIHPGVLDFTEENRAIELTMDAGRADHETRIRLEERGGPMPDDSCFASQAEADDWLRCEALGLSVKGDDLRLVEVERDAARWQPRAMAITGARLGFLETLGLKDTTPERAICAGPLDYRWRLGGRERLARSTEPGVPTPSIGTPTAV